MTKREELLALLREARNTIGDRSAIAERLKDRIDAIINRTEHHILRSATPSSPSSQQYVQDAEPAVAAPITQNAEPQDSPIQYKRPLSPAELTGGNEPAAAAPITCISGCEYPYGAQE